MRGRRGARSSFEFEDASGLRVRKEFRFDPRDYIVTVLGDGRLANGSELNPTVLWGPGLGDIGAHSGGGSFFTGNYIQPPQAIYHRDGDVERIAADELAEQPVHEGQFRFAGIDDHYFLAAARQPGQARVEYRPVTLPGPGESAAAAARAELHVSDSRRRTSDSSIGPKQFDLLRSIDAELVRAINFGMFGWLAVPLLGALQWIYGFVGNYGWAIVLLTILINIAIFPLRHKSVVSMRKMQALQPQLKAIQDRYAGLKVTDPARQKMNTEIMNLYREKGVNPASGCVPMLLQFPVLLAFYAMLSQSIELRGAAFGCGFTDLSQPDPYYVIPMLMAVTMFWQTKITPYHRRSRAAADDDDHAADVHGILSVGAERPGDLLVRQQSVGDRAAVLHQLADRAGHTAAVGQPAERRMKNVGAGRTRTPRSDRSRQRPSKAADCEHEAMSLTTEIAEFVQKW